MKPSEFLAELWGPQPPHGTYVQLWRLRDRRTFYLQAHQAADYYAAGHEDVYTGVALAHADHGPRRRCPAHQAAAIPGLWLDIDVNGGPDRKHGVAPSLDHAAQLAKTALDPTITIASGHGLHAWWLFDTPWRFETTEEQQAAAQASAQWQHLHRQHALKDGWTVDHTHDLARLLRPPGTINAKGGQRAPVTLLEAGGPRYHRALLLEAAAQAGPIPLPAAIDDSGDVLVDVAHRPEASPPQDLFHALLENSPDFKRTWAHARPQAWSMSEYDLSLCTQAAQAGWTDQQLADLIAMHRRVHDPYDPKGARPDYVRRTVAKARASHQRTQGVRELAALDAEAQASRADAIAALQALIAPAGPAPAGVSHGE